jgi:hypothetical protein
MIGLVAAATHSTAAWFYILIPVVLVLLMAALHIRRGGGVRGPFGGGRTQGRLAATKSPVAPQVSCDYVARWGTQSGGG